MADDPVAAFLAAHKAQGGSVATAPTPHASADPVAAFLSAHSATKTPSAAESKSAPSDPVAAFLGQHKAAQGGNPFAPVGSAAKTVATGVGNALDAQRFYLAKALTGKDTTDEQMTAERQAVGTEGIYQGLGKIPVVGHALQGASDVVQQTLTDPLTAETFGAGPILKALGLADKLAVGAGRVGKAITDTPAGALLHDTLNWGGQVTREQGKSTTNTIRGALNKASQVGSQTEAEYKRASSAILKPLTDEENMNVRRGMQREVDPATLSAKEQKAVADLHALTEKDFAERSLTKLTEKFTEVADRLSPEHRTALAQAIKTGTRPADGQLADVYDSLLHQTQGEMKYRQNYAPTKHESVVATPEAGHAAKPRTAGEEFDVRNLSRENVPTENAQQLHEGFDALAGNAGLMASKRVVHESLQGLLNDPAVKKLITDAGKATGEKRTNLQKVGDAWLKIVGYPRAATVSLTPRHAMNILDLAANTVPPAQFPGYMKNVMADAAKLVKGSPEDLAAYTKDSAAVSQDFNEHQPFFQNVPGLKHWTAANNKLVWAVDTAAKVNYERLIRAAHPEMSALEAGGQASERLVDYAHKSPLVNALRYVAPFGTFRGSIPGAVAGGVARNPARAALLNRATGGTAFGGKPAKGQEGAEFYGPTADVARGLDSPAEFLRGTLGAPVQAAGTLAMEAATGNQGASLEDTKNELQDLPKRILSGQFSKIGTPRKTGYARAVSQRTADWLNYKNPIDIRWIANAALAGVPEAGAAAEQIGATQFQIPKGTPMERVAREILRQTAGVNIR